MNILGRNFAKTASSLTFLNQNTSTRLLAFKSALALENLYPNSSLRITTLTRPPNDPKFDGFIPLEKIEISYSRSSGPGGQNVNKVNTKVDVRFKPESADWLSEEIRKKLLEKFENRITKEGYIIFKSDLTRSQQLNLADCLEKMRTSIRNCCFEPAALTEKTLERIRKNKERSARERLQTKREKSAVKSDRAAPTLDL